jgi:replication factor C large subunit
MLIEKYKPKKLDEIIGQKETISKITFWLKEWKPGKALLLYGPVGIGKSIILEIIANEMNMSLLEINSSDDRSASSIKEILLPASKEGSLFKKRLILIDEIDSFSGEDRGGIAEIIKIVKESAHPIILIANNAYDSKLKTLRGYCELIRLRRIPSNLIEKRLNEIAFKERLKIDKDSIRRIALNSDGDIRSAINDLEILSKDSIREREKDIFEILKMIFQGENLREILRTIEQSDKDIDEIFWWVEQNICNEYKKPEDIMKAFEFLSKADLFRGRIVSKQNYRFRKYMKDMIAGISSLNKEKKFVSYKPPDRLILLGSTKSSRKDAEEFYKTLGLHCSQRKIKEQFSYLKIIFGNKLG